MAMKRKPARPRRGGRRKKPKGLEPLTPEEIAAEELAIADEQLRLAEQEADEWVAAGKRILRELGIRRKPMGAKKLRAMLIEHDLDPESNEFSRGIIEMREE